MKLNKLSILKTIILLLINFSALFSIWAGPAIPALRSIDLLWFSVFILSSLMLTQDDE